MGFGFVLTPFDKQKPHLAYAGSTYEESFFFLTLFEVSMPKPLVESMYEDGSTCVESRYEDRWLLFAYESFYNTPTSFSSLLLLLFPM